MMRSWLLVAFALVVGACGGGRAYRVGVMGRTSTLQGTDLAVRAVSSGNGINGVSLQMQRGDTTLAKPGDIAPMVEKLAGDTTVKFILQQSGEGVPPAVTRVYYSREVPGLVLDPVLEKPDGRWIFYLKPAAHDEAQLMAGQAEKFWHPRRAAIVRANDPYGSVLATELRQNLPRGTAVVLDIPFKETTDTVVVAALEKTIRAAQPDVIFWLGPPHVLGIMLARLRQHLPDVRIMGSDAAETKRVYDNPDGLYNGLVFVRAAAEPGADTTRFNAFRYRFTMWEGGYPTSDAMLAYDATTMIAAAMRAGATSRRQIRDYVASLGRTRPPYSGISGPIAFDSLGVIRRPFGLSEVREEGVKAVPLLK